MNFVVIGATKGLGLCLTKQLLEASHRVAAGAVVLSAELEALSSAYPETLRVLPADVTDEAQIADAAAQAAGRIICRANPIAIPTRPFSTWSQSSPLLFFTTRTTRLRASMAFRTSP